LDISNAREGAAVYAMDAGRVYERRTDTSGALIIRLDHGGGRTTGYAHLRAFSVALNAQVGAGQKIGEVGNTGYSSGPHLHTDAVHSGKAVDLWPLLDSQGEDMSESTATVTLYPEGPRAWHAKGGELVGYRLNGSTKKIDLSAGSTAHADGTADITQSPQKAPNGSGFIRVTDGALAGYYLVRGSVDGLEPPAPGPAPDCEEAVAEERAKWEAWMGTAPGL